MSEKLRIGVFGGYRGSSMIQVLLHHPDAELVAVCDKYQPLLDKAKAEAEAAGLNIRVFNNCFSRRVYPGRLRTRHDIQKKGR